LIERLAKANDGILGWVAMGGVSRYRRAFFIAPIQKFIEDFNETINHWFWRNPHQGPYSFGSG
jgi:hypothetical protein